MDSQGRKLIVVDNGTGVIFLPRKKNKFESIIFQNSSIRTSFFMFSLQFKIDLALLKFQGA